MAEENEKDLPEGETGENEKDLPEGETGENEKDLPQSETGENEKDLPQLEKSDMPPIEKDFPQGGPPSDPDKPPKKPSERPMSDDAYRLRHIFMRPMNAEPRHPIFSSLFARHISAMAFGPKKPKWYTPLTSAQLYLFKDIMNHVEIGRVGLFRFDDFLEALQDFEPGITREEVVKILDNMEMNEFEELDYGKFLFLLAYKDQSQDVTQEDEIEEVLSSPAVTRRQCLILSAISYYVLIASPEEVARYYYASTRRKATVLHFHMEATRLLGLTELQMEAKQKKAMEHLGPLFAITGSPYALRVPFVPCTKKSKLFREWTDRRTSRPHTALPMKKKPIPRPIMPIKQSRELGDRVAYKTKEDKIFYDMHYGRLQLAIMKLPPKTKKEMIRNFTFRHKNYITKKAYESIAEYKDRLKKAAVIYNNRSLEEILKKGFPTDIDEERFLEIFQRLMPLKQSDMDNCSLWIDPGNYKIKHDGKPLYPMKYAFGSNIR